jgi:hypothetical protein
MIFGTNMDVDHPSEKEKHDFVRRFRAQCEGDLDGKDMHRVEKPLRDYPNLCNILGGAKTVKKFKELDGQGRISPRK